MSELKVVGDKRLVSRLIAIKEFFGMDNRTVMTEVKALKMADQKAFEWLGDESAKALGIGIDPNTL